MPRTSNIVNFPFWHLNMKKRRKYQKISRNLSRFFSFYFCFSGLPINFWYHYWTSWTLKYKVRAEIFFWIFFQNFFEGLGDFQYFCDGSFLENSPRTPRNRFHIPRSPRNVILLFLDSLIPRGMKFSDELPSLTQMKSLNFENWCSGKLSKNGHHFSDNVIWELMLPQNVKKQKMFF